MCMSSVAQLGPLKAMNSSIKVNNSVEPVNADQLFHRIIILKMTEDELAACFEYEPAPRPLSLFSTTSACGNPESQR